MRALLHNTRRGYQKVIPLLVDAVRSKSPVLRAKASDYMLVVLRGWSGESMARHSDELVKTVK